MKDDTISMMLNAGFHQCSDGALRNSQEILDGYDVRRVLSPLFGESDIVEYKITLRSLKCPSWALSETAQCLESCNGIECLVRNVDGNFWRKLKSFCEAALVASIQHDEKSRG